MTQQDRPTRHAGAGASAQGARAAAPSNSAGGLRALPAADRPRERLLAQGPAALSDAELLVLLLRTGLAGQGVMQLATQLLSELGGIAGLVAATPQRLATIKGLGPAKVAELSAVAEVARRALAQPLRQAPLFDRPQAARDFIALHLQGRPDECFAVVFVDAKHRLIALRELFRGSVSHTSVHPRVIVREALALNAAAVLLAHNHPSGEAEPSSCDIALTARLKAALDLVEVRVLDHLIVGQGQVVSLAERGEV